MASGKIISLWSPGAGTGRRTLAQSLAVAWLEQGKTVLIFDSDSAQPQTDPSFWVPRFQGLSPVLLRNYLTTPAHLWGQLNLATLPEAGLAARYLP